MNDIARDILDLIRKPPIVDQRIFAILQAMNRRMDEIEASVLKAKHDATPILGFTEVSPSSVSVESRTIKP